MTIARRIGGMLVGMESRRLHWRGRLAVVPVALVSLLVIALTGCGSKSSDNNSATNSPSAPATAAGTTTAGNTQALCRDVDALRAAISDLRNVKLNADAVPTMSNKVDLISTKLDQLKSDAKGSLRPQIDKVSAALRVLQSNLHSAVASPSLRNLSVIPPAIASVATTANDLRAALPNC